MYALEGCGIAHGGFEICHIIIAAVRGISGAKPTKEYATWRARSHTKKQIRPTDAFL